MPGANEAAPSPRYRPGIESAKADLDAGRIADEHRSMVSQGTLASALAVIAMTVAPPAAAACPHRHVDHHHETAHAATEMPSVKVTHDKCKSEKPKGLPPWCSNSSSWPIQVGAVPTTRR